MSATPDATRAMYRPYSMPGMTSRSGVSAACLEGFDWRYRERFAEYTVSQGISSSLQPLGALAWRRISGSDEPSERMTMLLARRELAALVRSAQLLADAAIPPMTRPCHLATAPRYPVVHA